MARLRGLRVAPGGELPRRLRHLRPCGVAHVHLVRALAELGQQGSSTSFSWASASASSSLRRNELIAGLGKSRFIQYRRCSSWLPKLLSESTTSIRIAGYRTGSGLDVWNRPIVGAIVSRRGICWAA